jgi:signal transduction histidine kinase
VVRRTDGTTFHTDSLFSPIRGINDEIVSIVCSLRDISVRISVEDELRLALDRERELNELKSRFVSMVSHEFRTPLAVILSSSNLVKNYSDRMSAEKAQSHLEEIQNQIQLLTNLLEDILTLARAENVGMSFHPVPLNLEIILPKFVEEAQHSASISHKVVVKVSDHSCTDVLVDEHLLRHIISNLLSNAMKYSPEGSRIFLDATCADGWATISIRDEGIGIPEADLARIFETFHRANNVGTISGTGLGLSILQQAVTAHNGTISFESKEGVGTTFTVKLPVAPLPQN